MIEENKIEDAEIIIEDEIIDDRKKQENPYIERILILILGILIGIAVKTQAVQKITIGFDDYLMKFENRGYDLNKIQDEQLKKMLEDAEKKESLVTEKEK